MKQKRTISTWGFIMAVLGAAVGLGGIWGFPTKMNQYGGTFLIPFFIALIICAIPILLIEMNLGNKYRKNHVLVFKQLANKPGKFFGFLQSSVVWLMSVFYNVLVAWSLLALVMAFLPDLTTKDFFLTKIIGQTNNAPTSFSQLGNISLWVILSLLVVWILTAIILIGGVSKGIDLANKIFIPTLFIIILGMMIFTMTLPGALSGLRTMFSFHTNQLLSGHMWSDAFGQAFFMLSTCTGAIIIFSSHAPKNQNNANKALIIAGGTVVVSLITACTIFSTMGAIAYNQHTDIHSVFVSGPTLIFQVFPQIFAIITQQTGISFLSHILAVLFFLSVLFAGLSSVIAMIEAVVNPLETEWNIKRITALIIVFIASILVDIFFIFNNSSVLIDGLASWVAGIWQMIIGIFEVIGVAWLWKCYPELSEFNNQNSWFKWDKYYFRILCLVIIPIIIALNLGFALYQLSTQSSFVLAVGTSIGAGGSLIFALIFTYLAPIKNLINKKWKQKTNQMPLSEIKNNQEIIETE